MPVSAERLSEGLVREVPLARRRLVVWIVSRQFSTGVGIRDLNSIE